MGRRLWDGRLSRPGVGWAAALSVPRQRDLRADGRTRAREAVRPFGRLRRTKNVYARQSFSFLAPSGLSPGAYRMYLYCRPCGGSLIQSGARLEGETIRLTARPTSRRIRVGPGAMRRRFLVSEPAGVILLLRLTVPHGTRASVTGSIPRLVGVMISSERREICLGAVRSTSVHNPRVVPDACGGLALPAAQGRGTGGRDRASLRRGAATKRLLAHGRQRVRTCLEHGDGPLPNQAQAAPSVCHASAKTRHRVSRARTSEPLFCNRRSAGVDVGSPARAG